jgi:hypothetical protein
LSLLVYKHVVETRLFKITDALKELLSLWRTSNKDDDIMQLPYRSIFSPGVSMLKFTARRPQYVIFHFNGISVFAKKEGFGGEVKDMSKTSYTTSFDLVVRDVRQAGRKEGVKASVICTGIVQGEEP